MYYSLDGIASDIWSLVSNGVSGERIGEMLAARFPDDELAVRRDVRALLAELVDEDLIRAADTMVGGGPGYVACATGDYAAPVLHKYTDMQAFMLADPLHDVDEEAGWPNVKAG